ncbi:MAG TPA: acetyl-CoA synthetase [Desulfotomaculum sp.]|nr:acetyl-CoA synthetase [Desulfotomaculum sp.]
MKAQDIIGRALAEERRYLYEDESKDMLVSAGIPATPCRVAADEEEAASIAGQIGYPVVLKVRSTAIQHKSDLGGVILNLGDAGQVRRAYREIMDRAKAVDPAAGVTVQTMAPPGREVIVGVTTDRQFGPVVMCGLGGVFTEILKDVSFRLIPLTEAHARDMIRSLQGYRLLAGYRGAPPADEGALVDILLKVSRLVENEPRIRELDLNPVALYPQGALVLDARMVLGERAYDMDDMA